MLRRVIDNGYIYNLFFKCQEVGTKHRHHVSLASLNLAADGMESGHLFLLPDDLGAADIFPGADRVNQQFGGCIYNSGFWRFLNY